MGEMSAEETKHDLPPGWEWDGDKAVHVSSRDKDDYMWLGDRENTARFTWEKWERDSGISRDEYKAMQRAQANLEALILMMRNGWRMAVDCGPYVMLVQDTYTPHEEKQVFQVEGYFSGEVFEAKAMELAREAVFAALGESS